MSDDLKDTLSGLAAVFLLTWIYSVSPIAAIGSIAFHVGVTSMRAHRARNKKGQV